MEEQVTITKVVKAVDIDLNPGGTPTKAVFAEVTAYPVAEGIYVYDLFDATGHMVAKARYSLVAEAPFVLTEEEIAFLNPVEDKGTDE